MYPGRIDKEAFIIYGAPGWGCGVRIRRGSARVTIANKF